MINKIIALELTKARLNRLDTLLDDYLLQRIDAAAGELAHTGIVLTDDTNDLMLVVDTVVWEYSNRDNQAGVPDWLRLRRRERWLQQRKTNN